MIALLHLLSILHIAICVTICWCVGNTTDLEEYDFRCYDLGKALGRKSLIYEHYMLCMFSDIANAVDPFSNYLDFIFAELASYQSKFR